MYNINPLKSNKRVEVALNAVSNPEVDLVAAGVNIDNFVNTKVFADSATLLGFTIVNHSDEEIHVTLKTNTYIPDDVPKKIKIYAGTAQSVTPPDVIYVSYNTGVL